MKGMATERQKEAVQRFGLEPPPTKKGCSNMLSFLTGCRWRGMSGAQKVAYARTTQEQWLSARVDAAHHGIGTIDYITCLSPQELGMTVRHGMDGNSSPFRFHIKGDNGKGLGLTSINALRRI